MNKKFGAFLPIIFTIFIIGLFHYTHWIVVKYYPVVVNFLIFLMFFTSLFQRETIIQKIARTMEPDIKPKSLEYTKNLTYCWAAFTLLNWLMSLATVFMSEKIWAIYNGFISYILVGVFFAVEYIVRIRFKRKYDC